jgi:hypothetical protein
MSTEKTLSRFLAFIVACAFSVAAAVGAETPKGADANVTPAVSSGKLPFIVHNPDGTFTVQKAQVSGKTDAVHKGLVIPPQVVVPMVRAPAKEKGN